MGQAQVTDQAFDSFFVAQFPLLVRYLCSHGASNDDAQDIAQESLLKLLRYREHPDNVLKALLYRIALNALRDLRRHQASGSGAHYISLDAQNYELPSEFPQPEQNAVHHQELARIKRAIDKLPDRCREIYLLHRIEGMSYSQISRHCGITVKAVEKHMTKALTSLRARLTAAPLLVASGDKQ